MGNDRFKIQGGHKLSGTIVPQGAKNEALQIINAVLLTDQAVTIKNIPDIRDTQMLISLMKDLGVEVEQHNTNDFTFKAKNVQAETLKDKDFRAKAGKIRGSVMMLGPMLARFKKAFLPRPGGDKIGRRRIDTHLLGFKKLGAKFNFDAGENLFAIEGDALKGAYMLLEEASVTGTANILMAAVLAEGKTTIYNAACEPYLQQLCKLLNAMGANITGIGSNCLHIEGVKELGGAEHRCLPDMIEIGSFIGLAAITRSSITIKDVAYEELGVIPSVFRKLGIQLELQGDDLFIPEQDSYEITKFIDGSILTISDAPWPGFTPDLLSIVLVVAAQAKGSVLIHQKMFESRLFFVDKLIDMGAQIILCDPHRAVVIGQNHEQQFRGIPMSSPDIRAGIALLMAALSAEGESIISNIEQIDRGYQQIDTRLQSLGAVLERI